MKTIRLESKEENVLQFLLHRLNGVNEHEITLISKEDFFIQSDDQALIEKFNAYEADIILAACSDFPFAVKGITLFYWKYYPRERGSYHYVHPKMMIGKAGKLKEMIAEITANYGESLLLNALNDSTDEIDVFHRYYLDLNFGFLQSDLLVKLDRGQKIFGTSQGRRSVIKWPLFTLRHGLMFYKNERARVKDGQVGSKQWDFKIKDNKYYNKRVDSVPAIIENIPLKKGGFSDLINSFRAYFASLITILKMFIYNRGKRKDHEIFRFRHNQNPEIKANIEKLISFLESGQPFSFTHFNDGEMTFIKKFQEKDHKEVWFGSYFGRIQDKYNKQLGELLKAAFLKRQDYYFIGIPCQISHPKLSSYAKELRPVDEFTIPAMTFHHNLSKYPRILGAIKKRKMYFVVNINQSLTFFKKMGFQFDDCQVIRVPFRNAHEEYDNLKEKAFEEGAVVMLMSGMLAKILCAYWFERNPNTTFIAFGSSFDDYIQSKINFNLYPENAPFSKTLIGSRSYLFGHKKHCSGCYDMTKPNPGN